MKNFMVPQSIVVHKFGGLGDYLCCLPFLEHLRRSYPESEITVIAAPSGVELLENSGWINRVVASTVLSGQGWGSVCSVASVLDLLSIKRRLNSPCDVFIDLTSKYSNLGVLKPWLTCRLAKPVFSIGLDWRNRSFFLDRKVEEDRYERKHYIQRYTDVLAALNERFDKEAKPPPFHLPNVSIPEAARTKAKTFFASAGGDGLKIGLHPGANLKYLRQRAWPVERFADLADRLADETDCRIFVSASVKEEFLVEALKSSASTEIHRIPATDSVIQFAAYLRELDLVVANDTGAMHLAVAMRTPTVGIFGHADYESYGTYPPSVPFEAVTLDLGEKNGPSPSTDDPRGLRKISPSEVHEACKRLSDKCNRHGSEP